MTNAILIIIAMLAGLGLAYKSKAGSNAGLFLLYAWIAGSCIAAFAGTLWFLVFLTTELLMALFFRRNLDFKKGLRLTKDQK